MTSFPNKNWNKPKENHPEKPFKNSPVFSELLAAALNEDPAERTADPVDASLIFGNPSDIDPDFESFAYHADGYNFETKPIQLGFYYQPMKNLPNKVESLLDNEGLTEVDTIEGLTFDASSKKKPFSSPQSLTKHLNGLSLYERQTLYSRKQLHTTHSGSSSANKDLDFCNQEGYLLSMFKFILYPDYNESSAGLDYSLGMTSCSEVVPKHMPDWKHIMAVIMTPRLSADQSGLTQILTPLSFPNENQREGCPICLSDQCSLPRITSCGHIFCLDCIFLYLETPAESASNEPHPVPSKWKKCPLCYNKISKNELKYLLYPNVEYLRGKIQFSSLTDTVLPNQTSDLFFRKIHEHSIGNIPESVETVESLNQQYYFPYVFHENSTNLCCPMLEQLYQMENILILQDLQQAMNDNPLEVGHYEKLLIFIYATKEYSLKRLRSVEASPHQSNEAVWMDIYGRNIFFEEDFPRSYNSSILRITEDSILSTSKEWITDYPNKYGLSVGTPYILLHINMKNIL